MKSTDTLFLLRNHFTKQQQAEIVRALARESLAWQAVQNPQVFTRALEQFGKNSHSWSPGNLALICLDVNFGSPDLTIEPLATLDPDLKRSALEAFEKHRVEGSDSLMTLEEAGLAALAIRERFRILGTWDGSIQELETIPEANIGIILSCLLAYIPDPAALLLQLAESKKLILSAVNSIYAQPGSEIDQAHFAAQIITHATDTTRLQILQSFTKNFPADAALISRELFHIEKLEYLTENFQNNWSAYEDNSDVELLPRQLYEAEVCRLAKKPAHAFRILERITQRLDTLQVTLYQKEVWESFSSGNFQLLDGVLKDAHLLSRFDPGFLVGFGLLLIENLEDERVSQLLRFLSEIPPLSIVEAAFHQRNGDTPRSRAILREYQGQSVFSLHIPTEAVLLFAQFLLDLGFPYEAASFITNHLSQLPADNLSLHMLVEAELAAGMYPDALEHARLAALLAPEDSEVNRLLAVCFEHNNHWDEALRERKSIIQANQSNPPTSPKAPHNSFRHVQDKRDYAACALNAGQFENALDVCWKLLESDPADGLTHHILGMIFSRKGEAEIALQHFIQANQLAPDYAPIWLDLANHYRQAGDPDKSIETLRAAIQALPGTPQLLLALSERLIEAGLPTQAHVELTKAANLIGIPRQVKSRAEESRGMNDYPPHVAPLEAHILLRLGSVLLELGQSQEACEILRPIYHSNEYRTDAAYMFARALAATGNDKEALSALSTAYAANPEDLRLALEYARLMAKIGEDPDKTVQILEKILDENPQIAEAIGLQAEALAAVGRYEDSLTHYQKAMETTIMGDPRWATRLALGLSHVAIQVGRLEIAIAALQEAIQSSPNHLALTQKLTEACQAARLPEDALEAAERALEIAPANLDNLEWYARQMDKLDHPQRALSALRSAVDLSPRNPSLLIKLGQAYQDLQYLEEAHESYSGAVHLPNITLIQLHEAIQALLELGDAQQAAESGEKVHEIALQSNDPIGAKILFALCEAYRLLGKPDAALQVLDEILIRNPDSISALYLKAEVHKSNGQFPPALACLKQVLTLDPDSPKAHLLAVDIYQSVGNLFIALEHARQACRSTGCEELNSANLKVAELAWQLYLPDEARNYLSPLESTTLNRLDKYQERKSRLLACLIDANQSDYSIAVELIKFDEQTKYEGPETHATHALIYAHQNEYDHAEQELAKCLEKLESDRQFEDLILDSVCYTTFEMGQFQKSLELSAMWAQTSPSNPRTTGSQIRALVALAENNQLLRDLDASPSTPQTIDGHGLEITIFDQLSRKLLVQLGLPDDLEIDQITKHTAIPDEIRRWFIRGKAVESVSCDNQATLEESILDGFERVARSANDGAAYAAYLRHFGQVEQAVMVASQYPNHSGAMIQLALAQLEGSPLHALGAALAALETCNPANDRLHLPMINALIARSADQAGETGQAYQAIEAALEDWPEQPAWHKIASEIATRLGKNSEAQKHLEKACSQDPQNKVYQLALAELYFEIGANNRSLQIYETLSELFPNDIELLTRLAHIKSELDDLVGAERALAQALVLQPDNPNILLFSAELSYRRNNFDQAAQKARSALKLEPENPAGAFLLARSLAGLNRRQEAMTVLDQALTYSNRPVELYLERIRLVRSIQGIQPAHQSLLALSHQYPDHPAILALLAEYYLDQGLSQEAYTTASKTIQIGSERLRADEIARLHTIMGRILRRTGQLDQAIHQYAMAMHYTPRQIELYLELGKVHQDRRQMQEALDIYEKAIDIAPDDPRAYQQAGITLKEGKDYPGAEKMIRRAAELAPHDISIHRLLGSLVALNLVHNIQ